MMEGSVKEGTRLIVLDSLRGIAAMFVFLFHCGLGTPLQSSVLRIGVTGVDLFFMISGFVILLTLQRTTHGFEFVVKRFTRLYPVYWVIVSFTALLILLKHHNGATSQLLKEYLGNLTMLQRHFGIRNLDEQYWTLEVEIAFYFLMLIIFLLNGLKSIEKIGLVILIFCIGYDTFLESDIKLSKYLILINHFPLFYAGIIFFKIRSEGENAFRYMALSLSFLGGYMLFNNGGRSMYYISNSDYLILLLIYFGVFALAVCDRLKFLSVRPLLFMGSISYSFYLIHQYVSSQWIIPYVQKNTDLGFYGAVGIALLSPAFAWPL